MALAFLFPGQGAQSAHMMDGFKSSEIVQQTFAEAQAILGENFWALLQGDENSRIDQTIITQPLLLTVGLAVYRYFKSQVEDNKMLPDFLAGHSLGEYTALVAAEALDFAEALPLVQQRAIYMQEAVPQGKGAMAAILGLDAKTVETLCSEVAESENAIVSPANYNTLEQTVIAGSKQAVEKVGLIAKDRGAKRVLPLPVSVPSHCFLMKDASEKLANNLNKVNIRSPKIPVIHNVDMQMHQEPEAIRKALIKQLYSPVRWSNSVLYLVELGVHHAIECSPSKVLCGLVHRVAREIHCISFTDLKRVDCFIQEKVRGSKNEFTR